MSGSPVVVGRTATGNEAALLLRARFKEGDAVVYPARGWKGTVLERWVETDGKIWVRVRRFAVEYNLSPRSFAVPESFVHPVQQSDAHKSGAPAS